MGSDERQLDSLINAVLRSSKYRGICVDLIAHIGRRELSVRRNTKEAIKATKNKLHQIGAAYIESDIDYHLALQEIGHAVQSEDDRELRAICIRLMHSHTSTKERIPILDEFYATTLGAIGPVNSVLDLACGLNPLAIPWMPLGRHVEYYAYDIYIDLMNFLQEFMTIIGIRGKAEACDITQHFPMQLVDLALVLKSVPCLEQLDKKVGFRLLEEINARHLLISFPVHSLTGRDKGMLTNYENRFYELVKEHPWHVQRFEFATELAFLVTK